MQKKHEGIYEQYPYSFDFLLVLLMDTGHSVVGTTVFLYSDWVCTAVMSNYNVVLPLVA